MNAGRSEARRPRVVVCGTKFGRVYLSAFRTPAAPFELAGIVARGSARSRACAQRFGVPLYTHATELPRDVDIACLVVRAGLLGGEGATLAKTLMARGIHVIQEHPLHRDELAECLRQARRHRVVYHLNTFYVHLAPVRHFIVAARALLRQQQALFVDAACGFQVAYALLDILGHIFGGVRPWGLAPIAPARPQKPSDVDVPFRSLEGTIAGVPLTLRIQNQLDPADPNNHAHLLHRITVGSEGGNLTLVNTHGPIVWTPRLHFHDSEELVALDEAPAEHLSFPSATPLGPTEAPSWRDILRTVWPAGVERALIDLQRSIADGEDPLRRGQYHLTLCQLWQDIAARLGPPELVRRKAPRPLSGDDLLAAMSPDEASGTPLT